MLSEEVINDMKARELLFTVGLAARRVGLSPERVRAYCNAGRLDHIRDAAGRRLIPETALERFAAERTRKKHKRA